MSTWFKTTNTAAPYSTVTSAAPFQRAGIDAIGGLAKQLSHMSDQKITEQRLKQQKEEEKAKLLEAREYQKKLLEDQRKYTEGQKAKYHKQKLLDQDKVWAHQAEVTNNNREYQKKLLAEKEAPEKEYYNQENGTHYINSKLQSRVNSYSPDASATNEQLLAASNRTDKDWGLDKIYDKQGKLLPGVTPQQEQEYQDKLFKLSQEYSKSRVATPKERAINAVINNPNNLYAQEQVDKLKAAEAVSNAKLLKDAQDRKVKLLTGNTKNNSSNNTNSTFKPASSKDINSIYKNLNGKIGKRGEMLDSDLLNLINQGIQAGASRDDIHNAIQQNYKPKVETGYFDLKLDKDGKIPQGLFKGYTKPNSSAKVDKDALASVNAEIDRLLSKDKDKQVDPNKLFADLNNVIPNTPSQQPTTSNDTVPINTNNNGLMTPVNTTIPQKPIEFATPQQQTNRLLGGGTLDDVMSRVQYNPEEIKAKAIDLGISSPTQLTKVFGVDNDEANLLSRVVSQKQNSKEVTSLVNPLGRNKLMSDSSKQEWKAIGSTIDSILTYIGDKGAKAEFTVRSKIDGTDENTVAKLTAAGMPYEDALRTVMGEKGIKMYTDKNSKR